MINIRLWRAIFVKVGISALGSLVESTAVNLGFRLGMTQWRCSAGCEKVRFATSERGQGFIRVR